jgi:hypothetical protein
VKPGGIVWVGLAIWLLILLGCWAISEGYGVLPYRGVEYYLHHHRLRSADIQRIIGGAPVIDAKGDIVIDPAAQDIEVYSVDCEGATEIRFVSTADKPAGRTIIIIIPDPKTEYQNVISGLDDLLGESGGPRPEVWIAAPQ